MAVQRDSLRPLTGGQSLSTSDLSANTPLTPPAGATRALVQAEGGAVRWRDDGGTLTASTGMRIADGDTLMYDADLSALRLRGESGTSKANVLYYA